METTFLRKEVTREQVLVVLREFTTQYSDTNEYDDWLNKGSYLYALRYDGRLYPPKYILSKTTGIPTTDFNGGEQTNRVFRQLGFDIKNK